MIGKFQLIELTRIRVRHRKILLGFLE